MTEKRLRQIQVDKNTVAHTFCIFDGETYTVIFTNKNIGFKTLGYFIPTKRLIIIKYSDRNNAKTEEIDSIKTVIIHELGHALLSSLGYGDLYEYSQEDMCNFVAFSGEELINTAELILKWWREYRLKRRMSQWSH